MCIRDRVVGTADTVNGGVSLAKHWDEMPMSQKLMSVSQMAVSYTHLRAHETVLDLVCRLLLEKKQDTDKIFIYVTHNTE